LGRGVTGEAENGSIVGGIAMVERPHFGPRGDVSSPAVAVATRAIEATPRTGPLEGTRHPVELIDARRPEEWPALPTSLAEAGLSETLVADLLLKLIYLRGGRSGLELCESTRLPLAVIDRPLRQLVAEGAVAAALVRGNEFSTLRFQVTPAGLPRARRAFAECRYVGPAPVGIDSYHAVVKRQSPRGLSPNPALLKGALEGLQVSESLFTALGAAIADGHSLLLYGPRGNGKTTLAERIGEYFASCSEIFVPYAVQVENSILTVFDPLVHRPTDESSVSETQAGQTDGLPGPGDRRWRKVRRPTVVIAGHEPQFDLRPMDHAGYYAATAAMCANGGMLLVDGCDRPEATSALLDRWFRPLTTGQDRLSIGSRRSFDVPWGLMLVLTSALDPAEFGHDLRVRRLRHKILIPPPAKSEFSAILRCLARERGHAISGDLCDELFANHYRPPSLPCRSDPQDLLQVIESICRFRTEEFRVDRPLLAEAAQHLLGTAIPTMLTDS
jgi:hypothetical protein